jgi:hypothetical protein
LRRSFALRFFIFGEKWAAALRTFPFVVVLAHGVAAGTAAVLQKLFIIRFDKVRHRHSPFKTARQSWIVDGIPSSDDTVHP